MHRQFITVFFIFFFFTLNAYCHSGNALTYSSAPDTARTIEKVHLHIDKSSYMPGDTIWLKAYVVDDVSLPSTASGTLYVELISESDSIINSLILPLVNGISFGNIATNAKNTEGYYRIRAYTQLMGNSGPESFYDKVIAIGNVRVEKLSAATDENSDIQFLPEGGNLLVGLPGRVAFKATNSNGGGINITGRVLDNTGVEITTIQNSYLGMGTFSLTPTQGITYTAVLNLNGVERKMVLPAAKESGYSLFVSTHDTSELVIKAFCTKDLLNQKQLKFVLHKNGVEYVNTLFSMETQVAKMNVATAKLPQGIMQVTLFDPLGKAVCERLVFIGQQRKNITIEQIGLADKYHKREATQFTLKALLDHQTLQNGSFSVAITNSDIVSPDLSEESHILTSLFLSTELAGHIENPNRYFMDDSDSTRVHLDNLLLAQGWRKINWQQRYTAEKAIHIGGKVTNGKGPEAAATVILMRTGKEMGLEETVTDRNGRFSFDLIYLDKASFIVQVKSSKSKQLNVLLDSIPKIPMSTHSSMKYYQSDTIKILTHQNLKNHLLIQQKRDGIELKEVKIKGVKNVDYSASGQPLNSGNIFQIILPKDLVGVQDIMDYLAMHLGNGINIAMNDYGIKKPMFFSPVVTGGVITNSRLMVELPVTINGEYIDEYFDLSVLPVKEIEKIQVYKFKEYPQLMTITMKDKKILYKNFRKETPPGTIYLNKLGYTATKEFYQVKYPLKKESKDADLRTTLYWAPNLRPGRDGKININYFNADLPGKHRIVLEGFDGQGNLIRKEWQYLVIE